MRDYLTNCEFIIERKADYKKADEIRKLFSSPEKPNEDSGCGNLCSDLYFDSKTKKAKFRSYDERLETDLGLYAAIPSALLMYRLACTFKGTAVTYGDEAYKFTWQFELEHTETKTRITFGEWKGGSLFWTHFGGSKDEKIPKKFKSDLVKLMTYLISDTCAHPYDGLVAGSVA